MKWMNEPAAWRESQSGLTVTSNGKTDFWRVTHDGGIRHSGHFYSRPISGDFRLTATFYGSYSDQYDQSGIMVAASETHWIKSGIEYVDGLRRASAVVTADYSDWAISAEPVPSLVTFQLTRKQDLIEISFGDPASGLCLFRQLSFPHGQTLQAGLMTASPTGAGFRTEFLNWEIEASPPQNTIS